MAPYWPPTFNDPNQPPTCSITSPEADETVSGIHTLGGTVYDPDGMIERVEIRIDDGEWRRVVGVTSWSYNLDTTSLTDGEHRMYVRSFDGTEYSGEVARDMVVTNAAQEPSILENGLFWAVVVLVIIIVLLLLILFMKRGGVPSETKEPEELKETEEAEATGESKKTEEIGEPKREAPEKTESESTD